MTSSMFSKSTLINFLSLSLVFSISDAAEKSPKTPTTNGNSLIL